MPATKIMLIRHAEKPAAGEVYGVRADGREDPRDLSVRGWQRAGALIALFGPGVTHHTVPALASPASIFAARPTPNSVRSLHTVDALAQVLSLGIEVSYGSGDEAALVAIASRCEVSCSFRGSATVSRPLRTSSLETRKPAHSAGRMIDLISYGYSIARMHRYHGAFSKCRNYCCREIEPKGSKNEIRNLSPGRVALQLSNNQPTHALIRAAANGQ